MSLKISLYWLARFIFQWLIPNTAQKMKFSIKDFFSKCDQLRRKLKKSLMENFTFFVPWKIKRVTIYQKILKTLATEKYIAQSKGFKHKKFWLYSFLYRSHIVSGIIVDYYLKKDRTVYFDAENVLSLGQKFWELLSETLKKETPVNIFTDKINSLLTGKCPYNLCERYIVNVGFI